MTVISRQTIRDKLAVDLTAEYGSSVFAVYPYMATGFEGKSPVVRILNGGSMRPRVAGAITQPASSQLRYLVQHYVLFNETGTELEQAGAEDTLDALEETLAQYVSDNDQVPSFWKSIAYFDYSEPALVKVLSFHYLLEVFGLEIGVRFNG